jgi:hypothetical protein
VQYLPKRSSFDGTIDLDEISSNADYKVEHPGIVGTEIIGAVETNPLT